ncbi:sensor histidine kinase [Hymenobacter sp. APR13]|uniref:sensor histidine kinase n=1 Tax=Hymenobacter sp. APR13 TaxID=1356852 RepID=UPI0004E09D3C|nr:histidine kinase [Hymenobacter sp. APR13]AII51366.1 hypothetical protein N008_05125 [Hymenobacter sp. APR13]
MTSFSGLLSSASLLRRGAFILGYTLLASVLTVVLLRLLLSPTASSYRVHWEAHLMVWVYALVVVGLLQLLEWWQRRRGRWMHSAAAYGRLMGWGALLCGPVLLALEFGTEALIWHKYRFLTAEGSLRGYEITREAMLTMLTYLLIGNPYLLLRYLREESLVQQQLRETEKRRREAELRALQQHVNPHFLFNSLHVLGALIGPDNDPAQQYLARLAHLYRQRLRQARQDVVLLEDELTDLNDLLYLLTIRFGSAYEFRQDIRCPQRLTDSLVPPAAVQELLHNAVKHNDASPTQPLVITLTVLPDSLEVSNARRAAPPHAAGTGGGLENLRARLHLLTERPLVVEATPTLFRVELPLIPLIAHHEPTP